MSLKDLTIAMAQDQPLLKGWSGLGVPQKKWLIKGAMEMNSHTFLKQALLQDVRIFGVFEAEGWDIPPACLDVTQDDLKALMQQKFAGDLWHQWSVALAQGGREDLVEFLWEDVAFEKSAKKLTKEIVQRDDGGLPYLPLVCLQFGLLRVGHTLVEWGAEAMEQDTERQRAFIEQCSASVSNLLKHHDDNFPLSEVAPVLHLMNEYLPVQDWPSSSKRAIKFAKMVLAHKELKSVVHDKPPQKSKVM